MSPQEIKGILKPLKTKEKGFSQPAGHLSTGCAGQVVNPEHHSDGCCCWAQGRSWVNHATQGWGLFKSEYKEIEELFKEFCSEIPQLSDETNSWLECLLGVQELYIALQSMWGRKAPAINGLTVEFYKDYWDIFAHSLLAVFNESLGGWFTAIVLQNDRYYTSAH